MYSLHSLTDGLIPLCNSVSSSSSVWPPMPPRVRGRHHRQRAIGISASISLDGRSKRAIVVGQCCTPLARHEHRKLAVRALRPQCRSRGDAGTSTLQLPANLIGSSDAWPSPSLLFPSSTKWHHFPPTWLHNPTMLQVVSTSHCGTHGICMLDLVPLNWL